MKQIQYIVLSIGIILSILTSSPIYSTQKTDAVSSATCPAVKKSIPGNLSIRITGKVKNEYYLSAEYLSTLCTVRIRTTEVTPGGRVMGAYFYQGIPLYFILDGIVPHKDKNDRFDRPLDLVISFISASGMTSNFSYGELALCNDKNPVTLAYDRNPLLPSKDPEKYKKNLHKDQLNGFRLICPGDLYDNRYLDNVIAIKLTLIPTTDNLFPNPEKRKKCRSEKLFYIKNKTRYKSSMKNIPLITIPNWFRIGHGRGIKSERPETVKGYALRPWLDKQFGAGKPGDFYVFSGCDGYRSIFSWSEIYRTENGLKMILIREEKGFTLGPVGDFFVDRDIRALSCVEKVSL